MSLIVSPALYVDMLVSSGWTKADAETEVARILERQRELALREMTDRSILDVLDRLTREQQEG